MTRANARELAVHLIYGRDFTGEEPETVVSTRLDREYYPALSTENDVYTERPSRAQLGYIDNVVAGVANRSDEINAIISQYAIGWDISRISRLTRAIMQLAIFETLYLEDVPAGVAVSEAVFEIVPEAASALISVVTSGVEQVDSSADSVQLSGRITCECGISSAMRVVCGVFSFGREMKIIRRTAAAAATRRPPQRNAAALLALLREDEYFC